MHGVRVRELCAEAARRLADESVCADDRAVLNSAVSAHTLSMCLLCRLSSTHA